MNAIDIPSLQLDELCIESHEMPVIVVWGNGKVSRFFTLPAAKAALNADQFFNRSDRSSGSMVFHWNGSMWEQVGIF